MKRTAAADTVPAMTDVPTTIHASFAAETLEAGDVGFGIRLTMPEAIYLRPASGAPVPPAARSPQSEGTGISPVGFRCACDA